MPNFDGTGPTGKGPRTGRGFGPCGMGFGRRGRLGGGCGLGRCFGCWRNPQTKEEKMKALSDYRQALEEELDDLKKEEEEVSKE